MKIFESAEALRAALKHGAVIDMMRFTGWSRKSFDRVIDSNDSTDKLYRAISAYATQGAAAFRIVAREDRIIKGPAVY